MQVAEKLRSDPRVSLMERTNLRHVVLSDLPGQQPLDIVTLDLSFISLLTVMPAVCRLMHPGSTLVALIKPQFEAARHQVTAAPQVDNLTCMFLEAWAQEGAKCSWPSYIRLSCKAVS